MDPLHECVCWMSSGNKLLIFSLAQFSCMSFWYKSSNCGGLVNDSGAMADSWVYRSANLYAQPLHPTSLYIVYVQVCPDVDGPLLATDKDSLSSPLLVHMADSLAKVFLPPVTSTSTTSSKMPAKRCVLIHYLSCHSTLHIEIAYSLHSWGLQVETQSCEY